MLFLILRHARSRIQFFSHQKVFARFLLEHSTRRIRPKCKMHQRYILRVALDCKSALSLMWRPMEALVASALETQQV
ncbi:hypothetical protein NAS141_04578 [Sulfitobacter sp. NAS-14.1]|nr:hypothetical protein NAS141_04578 [Sulfitobacter sp. NAS-14.1]